MDFANGHLSVAVLIATYKLKPKALSFFFFFCILCNKLTKKLAESDLSNALRLAYDLPLQQHVFYVLLLFFHATFQIFLGSFRKEPKNKH